MEPQRAAVAGQPVRIQIDDDGHRAAIVIAKLIAVPQIRGARCVIGKVAFVLFESEKELAIQRNTQHFHDREIPVADCGLARLQPPDPVAAHLGLERTRRALADTRKCECPGCRKRYTFELQRERQTGWKSCSTMRCDTVMAQEPGPRPCNMKIAFQPNDLHSYGRRYPQVYARILWITEALRTGIGTNPK
jgi:hypothetical protein